MKFFAFAAIIATAFASAAHSEEDKERLLATWAAQKDAGVYSEDTYNTLVQKLSEEEDSLDLAQTSVDADSLTDADKEEAFAMWTAQMESGEMSHELYTMLAQALDGDMPAQFYQDE